MGNTLEALKIERDVLREQTQGKIFLVGNFGKINKIGNL